MQLQDLCKLIHRIRSCPFQLSSRHDFFHPALRFSFSWRLWPERWRPLRILVSHDVLQLYKVEVTFTERQQEEKHLYLPHTAHTRGPPFPQFLWRERWVFWGVADTWAIASAVLKLNPSSEQSWERNERQKRNKISLTVSSAQESFCPQCSCWKARVSSRVFGVSACCTKFQDLAHPQVKSRKRRIKIREPQPLWFVFNFSLKFPIHLLCVLFKVLR